MVKGAVANVASWARARWVEAASSSSGRKRRRRRASMAFEIAPV
jgi:hypothetical protein